MLVTDRTALLLLERQAWMKLAVRLASSSRIGKVPERPGNNLLDASAGRSRAGRRLLRQVRHMLSIHGCDRSHNVEP
jgi:hypothetical protein